MVDTTESFRRQAVAEINSEIESNDPDAERKRLEATHGKVYDTNEVREAFEIEGFMAPYCVATERATRLLGSLEFQHRPRFYFNFRPHK
jgi:hypothetical protein